MTEKNLETVLKKVEQMEDHANSILALAAYLKGMLSKSIENKSNKIIIDHDEE